MPEVKIIYDFKDFIVETRELYEYVENALELRREEYKSIGLKIPARVKFEEVDLRRLTKRMLSIHKTLQSTRHTYLLNKNIYQDDAKKARLVAIAGICEFVKEEFVGKFWDAHRRIIDWGPDNTVYDWIWEKGFKEIGIPLIRSEFRREFVQTIVLESGVPKNRIRDIIDFFVIYWRYLRNINDVESLINAIIKGEQPLASIPVTDRSRLVDICKHAADLTMAFALAIKKLSKIFKFIEESDELFHEDIEEYENLIFSRTGINPLEILRDKDQIKKIYRLVLGVVTPQKLERILQAKPIGTRIQTPDGNTVRADSYKTIQYGEHLLDGAKFTCVPNTSIQLSELQNLPNNTVVRLGTGVLLKSKSKIRATVNGRTRNDLVLGLYTPNFVAHVFYIEQQPAMVISLRTEDGAVNTKLSAPEGFRLNSFLHYSGNFKKNSHLITANISYCRIKSTLHLNSSVSLVSDVGSEPLAIIRLDNDGQGYCSERSVPLNEPSPQLICFRVAANEAGDTLCINGKPVESTCRLSSAMLFSPYYGREFAPLSSSGSTKYGGKKFVLYVETKEIGRLNLINLNVTADAIQGEYTVKVLVWDDIKLPCKIQCALENETLLWNFEKCLHFNLYIKKVQEQKLSNLILGHLQGVSPDEFEMTINPTPPDDVRDKLVWGLAINNMEPVTIPFCNGPDGIADGPSLRFTGSSISRLASLARLNSLITSNSAIDISIGIQDHVFSSVKIWIFSDVTVSFPDNLRQGSEIYADAKIGNNHIKMIPLQDRRGSNTVPNLFKYNEGAWKAVEHPFFGKIDLEEYGTCLEICAIPSMKGLRFGNIKSGAVEPVRDIMKKELADFDLLVVSDNKPQLFVNYQNCGLEFGRSGNLYYLKMRDIPKINAKTNKVHCLADGQELEFKVLDRLNILRADFHHHIVNGCIHGNLSFSGPIGAKINVAVFNNPSDPYNQKIAELDLPCDGNEKLNIVAEIPLGLVDHSHEEGCYVRLYLIENDKVHISKAHVFGESWHVHLEFESRASNYEYLVERAKQGLESGKVFFACRCIEAAMKLAPREDMLKLSELKKKIDGKRNEITFKSLAEQSMKVLHKEFLLEI